jgi:hypothetical protein
MESAMQTKSAHQNVGTNTQSAQAYFCRSEISIEENPDPYRGGFSWSLSLDESELAKGLAATREDAMAEAHQAMEKAGLSKT